MCTNNPNFFHIIFNSSRYDTIEKTHDPEREKRILENLKKNIDQKKKKIKKEKKKLTADPPLPIEDVPESILQDEPMETQMVDNDEEIIPDESILKPPTPLLTKLDDGCMILGNDKFQRKQKIDVVLAPWLAYPTIISNDLTASGAITLNKCILPELQAVLHSMKIEKLFPVQEAVIPWILDVHKKPHPFRPRDLCVSAPTGSGKTLAYALPIVQLLMNRVDRKIRALIVLPVNELAVQVLKEFRKLCEKTSLTCGLLSKFVPFETEQSQLIEQFNGCYYSKVDIVIATTGRLVEHLHSTPGFSLKSLKFLVMDEADRIMEQIHNNWLYHLDTHVKEESDAILSGRSIPLCYGELASVTNRQPHKLLFSATLSQDPEKLESLHLFQPKLFTSIVKQTNKSALTEPNTISTLPIRGEFIGKFTTPAELTEKYCITQPSLKPLTLYTLIKENSWNRFLCFTNSGESAHRYITTNIFSRL